MGAQPMTGRKQAEKIHRAMRAALEHHRSGQWARAEQACRDVLQLDQRNAQALHLLGVLEQQAGRNNAAVDLISRALALSPAMVEAHYNLGVSQHALGQLEAAEAAYRRAVELKPDLAEAHYYLGACCMQQGKLDEAEAAYRRGLELMPEVAEGLNNLGIVCQERGRLDEAEDLYRRALALRPELAEAHNNLGLVCQALGRFEEAVVYHQNALRIEPGNALYWVFFSECLKSVRPGVLERVSEQYLLGALKKEQVDPGKVAGLAAAFICRAANMQEPLACAVEGDEGTKRMERLFLDGKLKSVLEMPLLLALMEEAVIPNYSLERLLTMLRRVLLNAAMRSDAISRDQSIERFASNLALQCFANEYVYAECEQERQCVAELEANVSAALKNEEPFPATWLLLLAAYRPLHALALPASRQWKEAPIAEVIRRQVIEPAQEQNLKKTIPRLTAIDDRVSQAVREQYEENPYPRWRRDGSTGERKPVHAVLRKLFPNQDIADSSPEHPEILVAGCGTGAHAVQVARHFGNARILAVDLSLASLAYAKRVTQELRLANIDYQQADILQLTAWDKRFDVIESCGVLHHMSDPLEGWRILVNLLRPGGYIKIGLYSARARRQASAARRFIAERGYAPTLEGIRRCRAALTNEDSGFATRSIISSADFYSTSACRDLLFHVEEHLFSPDEIERHLDRLGLSLLGFELDDPDAKNRYQARFPEDAACISLANWDLFEQDNPDTFINMYQFWARA